MLLSRTIFEEKDKTRTWGPRTTDEDKDLRSEDEHKDSNFKC